MAFEQAGLLRIGTITGNLIVTGLLMAPDDTGIRAEIGADPNLPGYPIMVTDGATRFFSVDNAGNIYATNFGFGQGSGFSGDFIDLLATAGFNVPGIVQHASAGASSATTLSVACPAPTTAGNMLVVALGWARLSSNSTAPLTTPPAGYTSTGDSPTQNHWAGRIYYLLNCAGGDANPSFTVANASEMAIAIAEVSGIPTAAALDKHGSVFGTSAHTQFVSGSAGPTTQTDEMWLASIFGDATQDNPTGGFTLIENVATGGVNTLALGAVPVSSLGTAQMKTSITNVHSGSEVGLAAAFKSAPLGALPLPPAGTIRLHAKMVAGVPHLFVLKPDSTDVDVG